MSLSPTLGGEFTQIKKKKEEEEPAECGVKGTKVAPFNVAMAPTPHFKN